LVNDFNILVTLGLVDASLFRALTRSVLVERLDDGGADTRKSAAIIPFVNRSLTSGLPIGSGPEWLMNSIVLKRLIKQLGLADHSGSCSR
jgi:hypothetical protein